jgi:hypothetical protein
MRGWIRVDVMHELRGAYLYLILMAAVVVLWAPCGDAQPSEEIIRTATVPDKGMAHVVFRETISSKNQSDWTGVYKASVEVQIQKPDGTSETETFKGSTLPNFKPGKGKPDDWQYSVVMANCAFPSSLQGRYYKWTFSKRAESDDPCLRLTSRVPTVAVGSERVPAVFLAFLTPSQASNLQYADNILVHAGNKANWRGSAGCLTIDPTDQERFFSLLKDYPSGTLEIVRGIEDSAAGQSYCY